MFDRSSSALLTYAVRWYFSFHFLGTAWCIAYHVVYDFLLWSSRRIHGKRIEYECVVVFLSFLSFCNYDFHSLTRKLIRIRLKHNKQTNARIHLYINEKRLKKHLSGWIQRIFFVWTFPLEMKRMRIYVCSFYSHLYYVRIDTPLDRIHMKFIGFCQYLAWPHFLSFSWNATTTYLSIKIEHTTFSF